MRPRAIICVTQLICIAQRNPSVVVGTVCCVRPLELVVGARRAVPCLPLRIRRGETFFTHVIASSLSPDG